MVMFNCVSLTKGISLLPTPPPQSFSYAAKNPIFRGSHEQQSSRATNILMEVAGITIMSLVVPSYAAALPVLSEPSNALSLPTWAVHVSSVVEWATAMALVWQYGEKSGYESWKGLSWGMILVALQAALTVLGNATMCFAAYRIYTSSEERSRNS